MGSYYIKINTFGDAYILSSCFSHVYYMSGDAWKEGGIDATGIV